MSIFVECGLAKYNNTSSYCPPVLKSLRKPGNLEDGKGRALSGDEALLAMVLAEERPS